MPKDYEGWHREKRRINETGGSAFFHEREIWWCTIGENVGSEQDGGKRFMRPVIILKKFNLDACLVVPLTGRLKQGKYYFSIGMIEKRDAVAIISQIRFIDRKRLAEKISTLDKTLFRSLIVAIIRTIFPV